MYGNKCLDNNASKYNYLYKSHQFDVRFSLWGHGITISLDYWKKSLRTVYEGDFNPPATIWTCKYVLISEHLQTTLGYTLASNFSWRNPFLDRVSDN